MSSNQNEQYPEPSGSQSEDQSRSINYESVQSTQQSMAPTSGVHGHMGDTGDTTEFMEYTDDAQMSNQFPQQEAYQQMNFSQGPQDSAHFHAEPGPQSHTGSPSMSNPQPFQGPPTAQHVHPSQAYPQTASPSPQLQPEQHSQQQHNQPINFQQQFQHQHLQNQQQQGSGQSLMFGQHQRQQQEQNQHHLQQNLQATFPQEKGQLLQQEALPKQHHIPIQQSQYLQYQHQQPTLAKRSQQPLQQQQQQSLPPHQQQFNQHQQQQNSYQQPVPIQHKYEEQQENKQLPPEQQHQGNYKPPPVRQQQHDKQPQNQSQYNPNQKHHLQYPNLSSSGQYPGYPMSSGNTSYSQPVQSELQPQSQRPDPKGPGYQTPFNPVGNQFAQPFAYQTQPPGQGSRRPNPQMQYPHLNPDQPGHQPAYQIQSGPQVSRYQTLQMQEQYQNPNLSYKPVVPAKPYMRHGQRYSTPQMQHSTLNPSLLNKPQLPAKPSNTNQQIQHQDPSLSNQAQPQPVFPQHPLYHQGQGYQSLNQMQQQRQTSNVQPDIEGYQPSYQNQQMQHRQTTHHHSNIEGHPPSYQNQQMHQRQTTHDQSNIEGYPPLYHNQQMQQQYLHPMETQSPVAIQQQQYQHLPDEVLFRRSGGDMQVTGDVEEASSPCLKVTGLSRDSTEDTVRYFFENRKRGGPLERLQVYPGNGAAFLRFRHPEVAERVLNGGPYILQGLTLQVNIVSDFTAVDTEDKEYRFEDKDRRSEDKEHGSGDKEHKFEDKEHRSGDKEHKSEDKEHRPGDKEHKFEDKEHRSGDKEHRSGDKDNSKSTMEGDSEDQLDEKKLLVLNIARQTTEDTIKNFLENKADADVCNVTWGSDKSSAVVSFETNLDVEAVIEASKNLKLDGQKLKIRRVERSRCVKVSGLSPQSTEDSVRYHFENKKRGGAVHTVEIYQRTASALVRFESYGVAEGVCSRSHKLLQRDVAVEMYIDTPGFTQEELSSSPSFEADEDSKPTEMVESLKVLIQNLNPKMSEDSLVNYLEAKAGADVNDVKWGKQRMVAIVTFKNQPDLEKLKQSCKTKKLEGKTMIIEMVERSRSIIVTRLPDKTTKDSVLFYFENKMRSGGGPIEDIRLKLQYHSAVVKFTDFGVAERVCSQSHKLLQRDVDVEMYIDTPGFTQEELSSSPSFEADEDSEPTDMVESLKVLIQNLNPKTSEDSLVNYLEAKAGADVNDVKWRKGRTVAIVTFKDQPDLEKLKQSCKTKKLEGKTMTIEMVERSRSIIVTRLPDKTTNDSVLFYFENKKKSGGGPIEDIKLNFQHHSAVVKFRKFAVAESVCSKSDHKIEGNLVMVVMYEDISGFDDEESDDEEGASAWKCIIKDVEPLKIRYISKSEEESKKLEKDLRKYNVRIKYMQQQMESLAEVSCTGTAQGVDEDVWTVQVQNAFRKSVEEMKLDVEGIDVSEVSQGIIDSLGEVVEGLRIKLYRNLDHQRLYIVGKQDDVKRASHKVKQTLAGPKISKVMEVKSFQAQYLKLSNTETKSMENFPSVSIDVDTHGNKVNLEGPTKDLDQVQIWLHEILAKLCSKSHSFKTDHAVGIMKGRIFKGKLENENIKFVWQSDGPRSITLFSERDDDIKKAKEFIGENVCEEVISLDQASASNLGTASWREEKRALLQTHEGSVEMSEDSNTISVAATNDVFQEVIDSIDKFFEIRTVRHVLVPVEVPKVKFLRQHCMSKARKIEQKLLDEKVHIDFEEGSYTSGVKIAGLKEGIAKARKDMEKLLKNINCKECKIPAPGIKTFFKKGNGKEILTGIEQSTNTIICPKEAHKRRKPLKTWTTSAGIVSVVKGDLCQMKVNAIVYAATKDLKLVTGLGKAIAEKGGKAIQDEAARVVKDKGQLSECDVVSTGSGHLPCKHVLHAMLPKYKADAKGEHKVKTVLINILKKCDKKNIHSIGLSALGSSNGYPLEEVVKVIVETLSQKWTSDLGAEVREVVLCDLKSENTKLFIKTCDAILAGARPRRQRAEEDEDEDEDDSDSNGSGSESESDSSGPDTAPSRNGITVKTGELSKQKADVLINPTNKELNLSVGAVSKSLLEDGGHGIQKECKEKYPSGINVGEVASTKGGKLKCKEIFHGVLQVWKKDGGERAETVLGSLVTKCLKKADSRGYQSIAFPALGTGKLGFPADVSANLMHDTAADFLKTASSLTTVVFVVHARDTAVKNAFETEVSGQTSSGRSKRSHHHKTHHHRSDKGHFPDNFKFNGVEVKIFKGDITLEKTDCIVSCCDESFELKRGALSKAVLAKAGPKLQEECTSKRDEFNDTNMAITDGHKLACKKLVHLKVQSSPRDWGTLFLGCLEKVNDEGLKSVSFPALGTGGQKMSPEKMASSLQYAVKKFAEKHKHSKLTLVRVVIFQESMVNTYRSVFAGHMPGTGAGGGRSNQGGHHRGAHGGEVSRRPDKNEDEIVLCVYSDSWDNIKQAQKRILERCREEFDEKEIGEPFEQIIEDLDSEEMSKLFGIAEKHKVVLKRSHNKILLQGRVKDVSEVRDKLANSFIENEKLNHMKEEAKMVANLVQWSYEVGDKTKPFTIGLNCCLEKAYNEKKSTIEIKDGKGREYKVDLKKKVEYPKGGGKPIKIERFEKAIRAGLSKLVKGEKDALAGTKTVYFSLKPERNFKGDAEDLHFRTAESQFYRLLAAGQQFRVIEVEYVVNPGLKKKFRAAQDALKKKHGDDTSDPVLAFHGTNEGNISKICEEGFKKPGDKGFAAATDSGYYGSGVYFSEFPAYSIAYIKGASKLLLCQVILGHVYKCPGLMNGAKLQAGHDSHMSPDGKELIIYDTDCILPCYIVHYDQSAKGLF